MRTARPVRNHAKTQLPDEDTGSDSFRTDTHAERLGQEWIYRRAQNADIAIMKQWKWKSRNKGGLTRRELIAAGLLGLTGWAVSPVSQAFGAVAEDLEKVSRIPLREGREGPLLVFHDFRDEQDVEVEKHLRRQLSLKMDLLRRIKQKIGFEKRVRLSIEEIQVRLLFIPQAREAHADAYLRYCRDITATIFRMNRMESFYASITRPENSFPEIPETGISAFLVHRLAKEFRAVCKFTAESGESIKYAVSGSFYSNHLGAVDLEIQAMAPGSYELARKPFTIWQNDTADLYTLMAIPVEETLHYLLGAATDRTLARVMQDRPPQSLAAARTMAEEWMAVEESVVGGLVEQLLDMYCAEHGISLPVPEKPRKPATNPPLAQYRYRQRGQQLVADIGFRDAMALYMDSPTRFRERL